VGISDTGPRKTTDSERETPADKEHDREKHTLQGLSFKISVI
jgi:hypothetical protein